MLRPLLLLFAAIAAPAAADPLEVFNDRLFLDVVVNGVETRALLDSGAELSVASPAFARRSGIVGGEEAELKGTGATSVMVQLVENARVEAVGNTHDAPLVVMDLDDISTRLIGRPLDFILGRPFLDSGRWRIDLAGGTIDAVGPDVALVGTLLALTSAEGIETLPVTLGGETVPALFDLGNGNVPIVSKGLADRLGLERVGVARGGGVGGEISREKVILPQLVVAGVAYDDLVGVVDASEESNMLNLGTSVFRDFVIVTDFAGRQIALQTQAGR